MLSRQSETGSLTCEGMQAAWLSTNIIKLYTGQCGLGQICSHRFGRDPPKGNDCSKSLECCRWSLRKKKEQLEEAGDLAGANAIPPPGASLRTLSQTGLCLGFLWFTQIMSHHLSAYSQGDPPKKKKGFFEATTYGSLMCDCRHRRHAAAMKWNRKNKKNETLPLAEYVGDIQGWGLGLTGRHTSHHEIEDRNRFMSLLLSSVSNLYQTAFDTVEQVCCFLVGLHVLQTSCLTSVNSWKAVLFDALWIYDTLKDCCIKYVKEVLRGFNHCSMKLGERMKFWMLAKEVVKRRTQVNKSLMHGIDLPTKNKFNRFQTQTTINWDWLPSDPDITFLRNSSYQPIVSQDKDTFIRRYKPFA